MKVVTITNIINKSGKTTLAGLYASYLKEIRGLKPVLVITDNKKQKGKTIKSPDYRIITIEREKVNNILKKLTETSVDVAVIDYTPDTEIASIQSILACSDRLIIPFTNSSMDIAAVKILLANLKPEEISSKVGLLPAKFNKKRTIEKLIRKNFKNNNTIENILLPYINNLNTDNCFTIQPELLVRTRPSFNKILDFL